MSERNLKSIKLKNNLFPGGMVRVRNFEVTLILWKPCTLKRQLFIENKDCCF